LKRSVLADYAAKNVLLWCYVIFCQIVQMVLGCLIMGAVVMWANPSDCNSSMAHQLSGSLMYLSYLVLFLQFFHSTYLKKQKSSSN